MGGVAASAGSVSPSDCHAAGDVTEGWVGRLSPPVFRMD